MKRKLISFYCLLLLLTAADLKAQQAKLDSLIKANADYTKEDNKKLQLLNQLTFVYNNMQFDSAELYADKTITLAQKLNNQKGLAEAYNNKSILFENKSKFDDAISLLSKAIDINSKIKNQSELAYNYLTIGIAYLNKGTDSLSLIYFKKGYDLYSKLNNAVGIALANSDCAFYYRVSDFEKAKIYFLTAIKGYDDAREYDFKAYNLVALGNLYALRSLYDSSLYFIEQSLAISKKSQHLYFLSLGYGSVGYTYSAKGDYTKAIKNYLIAIRYCEQTGNEIYLAYNLNNLAWCYHSIGDYKNALYYLNKQLPISLKLNDLYSLSGCYQEFGNVYVKQKKFKDALEQYRLAYKISIELNRTDRIAECYGMLGDAFEGLMQYDSAFYYFRKGIELNKKIGYQHGYTANLISIARTLKDMPNEFIKGEIKTSINTSGKNQQAIDYATEALHLVQKSGELDLQRNVSQVLSELYEKENNFSKSFEYYKQYVSFKDSILNTENSKSIANLQIQYESEKKEHQIALLNKDKQIQQTEFSKQKTTRNSFIGGFVLVLILVGVTFNRYRVKQKANEQLSQTLSELKTTQQQLIEQEKFASLGQLTAGIAHEIQNPMNFIINFSELSDELIEDCKTAKNDVERKEVLTDMEENLSKITRHGKRADAIVKSMLLHSRGYTGEKQLTDINSLCEDALMLAHAGMNANNPGFNCDINKQFGASDVKIKMVAHDISRVILNLLNNAFHTVYEKSLIPDGAYKPTVFLITQSGNNQITISVKDNGLGVPETIRQKIFQPFFTTKSTSEGTGLGLSICYDIIKAHGGEIKFESKENEFTEFTVSLPA